MTSNTTHPRRAELIAQYAALHAAKPDYGRSSEAILGPIMIALSAFEGIETVLDYGCGRSLTVDWVAKLLDAQAYRYDPAIPEHAEMPVTECDVILCTDVMEHIPMEDLDNVIAHIAGTSQLVYFNICTRPAGTILPNGENAHCTVKPAEWWFERLQENFPLIRKIHSIRPQNASFITIG